MKTITLGSTGITTVQNAFGALPIQRISTQEAVHLLRKAYDGGMTFFDTARAYSDSEKKMAHQPSQSAHRLYRHLSIPLCQPLLCSR